MVRLRHHWTMLCSLLSLIKIRALMLQNLLAFPHTVFSINISVLRHTCIRVPRSQHFCTKCPPGCELWQSSSLRDSCWKGEMPNSLHSWGNICASYWWLGAELAWARHVLPCRMPHLCLGPCAQGGQEGTRFHPGLHGHNTYLLTAWPCSHCIHGTADELGSLRTDSLHQLCLQKAKLTPLLVLEKDNMESLHSLQREPHTGVDFRTNIQWSANNCTRFYVPQIGREMNGQRGKIQQHSVRNWKKHHSVFSVTSSKEKHCPTVRRGRNESPAPSESGNTCVGIRKRVSIKISIKIFYLTRK